MILNWKTNVNVFSLSLSICLNCFQCFELWFFRHSVWTTFHSFHKSITKAPFSVFYLLTTKLKRMILNLHIIYKKKFIGFNKRKILLMFAVFLRSLLCYWTLYAYYINLSMQKDKISNLIRVRIPFKRICLHCKWIDEWDWPNVVWANTNSTFIGTGISWTDNSVITLWLHLSFNVQFSQFHGVSFEVFNFIFPFIYIICINSDWNHRVEHYLSWRLQKHVYLLGSFWEAFGVKSPTDTWELWNGPTINWNPL